MSGRDPRFTDRLDAGRRLATELLPLAAERPVVVGVARGGIPVAYEVATALGAPLDFVIARKLGVPFQPEVGMGAVGEGDVGVVNEPVVSDFGVTDKELARVRAQATRELERLATRFRRGRPTIDVRDRVVVIVDDGLATGGTVRTAVEFVRARGARRIVVAVPVAAPDAVRRVADVADDVVALFTPDTFRSVGQFYGQFAQTLDDEVVALLIAARSANQALLDDPDVDRGITFRSGGAELHGRLTVPVGAFGVVVGALASEDGRHGARTRHVATALHAAGMGTLVLDLLADGEATRRESVGNVPLLTDRLRAGVAWLRDQPVTGTRPIGLLAVGLATGAALTLAGEGGAPIEAVASLAGRLEPARSVPDPAGVPTLVVIDDPDDLDGVTATFARWFVDHLGRAAARAVTSEGRAAD